MCGYYNKNSKSYAEFNIGQPVLFKKDSQDRWHKGQNFQKLDLPISYIVEDFEGN